MATIELVDVELCADCVVVAHNGRETGVEYDFEPMSKLYHDETVSLKPDEDGFTDPFFSWANCDGCETNLGGERYDCVVARSV